MSEPFLAKLQAYIQSQLGSDATITDARPLAGGASRDTWFFTVETASTQEKLVLRRDTPSQMFDEALTRAQEYHLMNAAYDAGVKVARVRWLCDDESVLDFPFFIMDYVEGVSIGTVVMRRPEFKHARSILPSQMASELATIHTIDFEQEHLAFLRRPPADTAPAQVAIDEMYRILDSIPIVNPTWEWTLRWAQTHLPPTNDITFVHGDFRIGNLLVDPQQGLTAVIDWEFGHIGNPDEELGYLCMRDWRFGNGQYRAAGLTDRETFLKAYETASGRIVSRESVDWWEVMGNIRWGIICMSQANRHLSGEEPSVELASLGRRSAEMQLEVLRLIESYGIFA
ncbi:MAG: phosphotransferase family protein [Chloroflexota bacterium]